MDTALVVPLRQRIAFTPDGRLADVPGWTRTLSAGGRLRSVVDFGASAGSRPVTWLLDPALPDAVRQLAAGNPPRSLAADEPEGPGAESSETPTGTPSATPRQPPTSSASASPDAEPVPPATVEAANAWLERLDVALQSSQILALPYGDLDVAATAKRARSMYQRARNRSDASTPGAPKTPAVAPPRGLLDVPGLRLVEGTRPSC